MFCSQSKAETHNIGGLRRKSGSRWIELNVYSQRPTFGLYSPWCSSYHLSVFKYTWISNQKRHSCQYQMNITMGNLHDRFYSTSILWRSSSIVLPHSKVSCRLTYLYVTWLCFIISGAATNEISRFMLLTDCNKYAPSLIRLSKENYFLHWVKVS